MKVPPRGVVVVGTVALFMLITVVLQQLLPQNEPCVNKMPLVLFCFQAT